MRSASSAVRGWRPGALKNMASRVVEKREFWLNPEFVRPGANAF